MRPATLLRQARGAAGLTQRQLARRARTPQSVVARIESGVTSPRWHTLARLVAATGFELRTALEPRPTVRSHMLRDVTRILRLSPEGRLDEVRNVDRLIATARRA